MPSYNTPKKNTEYIFYVSLVSQANANLFQVNPTLAAGDVKVSIDGGTEANITTLPVVTPAGSKRVKVTLSATEMNGDNVQVTFSDAAGAEWADLTVNIQTTSRQIDDLAYPTTSGRSIDVTTGGAVGIDWANIENQGTSVNLSSTTTNLVNTTTTNTDMRGTDSALLAASVPANFGDLSIEATTGEINVGKWLGTAVSASTAGTPDINVRRIGNTINSATNLSRWLNDADFGTCQATGQTSTNVRIDSGESANDDEYNGQLLIIYSGTGDGQSRIVIDYDGTNKDCTVYPPLGVVCDGTSLYQLIPMAGAAPKIDSSGNVLIAGTKNALDDLNDITAASVWAAGTRTLTGLGFTLAGSDFGASSLDGKGDWNIGKTGYSISGTKTTLDALNDITTAQVNSEVDSALVDIGLDHLVSAAVTGTDITDNCIIAKIVSSSATADWDSFVNTDDSLQAISESGGGGPTTEQIADAVWDEDIVAAHNTANSAGAILDDLLSPNDFKADVSNLDVAVSTRSSHSAANVWTSGTRTLTALGFTLGASDFGSGSLNGKGDWFLASNAPTNFSDLAITATTGLVSVGTNSDKTGYSISGAKTTLDALNDITAVNVRTEMDSNSTQLAAIVADTNELQIDWVNGGRLDLLIDGIKAKTDSLTFSVANNLDANMQYVNDVALVGDGSATPWGP